MNDEISTLAELRKLEKYVRMLPSMKQISDLPREEQKLLQGMQGAIAMARRFVGDAVSSKETADKLASVKEAGNKLELFRIHLLEASQYDLVGAADVAQLSATADGVIDYIKS